MELLSSVLVGRQTDIMHAMAQTPPNTKLNESKDATSGIHQAFLTASSMLLPKINTIINMMQREVESITASKFFTI